MDRQTDTRFRVSFPIARTSTRGFTSSGLSEVPLIQTDFLIVNSGALIPSIIIPGLISGVDLSVTNINTTTFTGTNTYLSFFAVKEGTNRRMGTAVLPTGNPNQVTVNNTSITNTTRVFLTAQTGTVANMGFLSVPTRSSGNSFVIQSSSITDNSTVAWLLVEPGA